MALEQQGIRFVLETQGDEVVEKLATAVEAAGQKVDATSASFKAGDISAAEYAKQIGVAGTEYQKLATLLEAFRTVQQETRAETERAAQAQAKAAAATETFAQALDRLDLEEREHTTASAKATAADQLLAQVERQAAEAAEMEAAAMARVAAEMGHVTSTYQVNATAAGTVATAATKVAVAQAGAAAGTGKYQETIRGLSYTLNDFFAVQGSLSQRLNAIANNLPMLLAGFGSWGLILSGLVPIIAALLPYLNNLAKALGFADAPAFFDETVKQLKAKIEELEKTPIKTTVEINGIREATAQLEQFQKGLAAFRQAESLRTKAQEESAAAVQNVIKEAGAPELLGKLREKEAARIETSDPVIADAKRREAAARINALDLERQSREAKDAGHANTATGLMEQALAAHDQERMAADQVKQRTAAIRDPKGDAAAAVGHAMEGAAAGKPEALAAALAGIGRGDLAKQVRDRSPEALAAQAKGQQEVDDFREEAEATAAAEKKANAAATTAAKKRETDAKHAKAEHDAKVRHDATEAKGIQTEAQRRHRELASGLPGDFLAQAEASRLAVHGRGDNPAALGNLNRQLQLQGKAALERGGVDKDRASVLAQGIPAFVDSQIKRQIDQQKTQGGLNDRQATNAVYGQLQQIIATNLQASAMANQLGAIQQGELAKMRRGAAQNVSDVRRLLQNARTESSSALNYGGPGS
jgi:hypothetical protein